MAAGGAAIRWRGREGEGEERGEAEAAPALTLGRLGERGGGERGAGGSVGGGRLRGKEGSSAIFYEASQRALFRVLCLVPLWRRTRQKGASRAGTGRPRGCCSAR